MTTAYHKPLTDKKGCAVHERMGSLSLPIHSDHDFLISLDEAADKVPEFSDIAAPKWRQKLVVSEIDKVHPRNSISLPIHPCLRPELMQRSDSESVLNEDEDDEIMRKWTLSPMSSIQSSSITEIPFISPQSTINLKRSSPGSALSEIRVETGLFNTLPQQLRLSPNRLPCAVFALINLETGKPRWLFVKEYDQLANFNDLIQCLLAPLFKQTGFRLREFPSRDLFMTKIPWKVDLRNDMLNAYFKSLFWLYDMDCYIEDPALQESVERAINALWLYDKVEPSPMRSFGLYGEDMCGFLLSRSRATRLVDWDCHYYAMNGGFLDVIDNLATGHVRDSICLFEARIEKLIVFYLAKADNARYAINIYEKTVHGKKRLHTICAENEVVREKWLYHLRRRVSHLTVADISKGARSKTATPPLPYVLPKSSRPSPYLPENNWGEGARTRRGVQHLMASLAKDVPDSMMMPHLFRVNESYSENGPSCSSECSSPNKISISEISSPVATLNLSRDAVLAEAIALDAQDITLNTVKVGQPPSIRLHNGDSCSTDLHRSPTRKSTCPGTGSPCKPPPPPPPAPQRSAGLVFGVMPQDCKHQIKLRDGESVPSVVARCLELLSRHKANEEMGLFRISGAQKKLDELEGLFDQQGDYDMIKAMIDIHTTADLLKRYLRELPDKLLVDYPEARVQQLLAMNENERITTLKADLASAEPANLTVVGAVLKLLHSVSRKEAKNAMGPRNLGVAMSPSLRMPIPILEIYIKQYRTIFE